MTGRLSFRGTIYRGEESPSLNQKQNQRDNHKGRKELV